MKFQVEIYEREQIYISNPNNAIPEIKSIFDTEEEVYDFISKTNDPLDNMFFIIYLINEHGNYDSEFDRGFVNKHSAFIKAFKL